MFCFRFVFVCVSHNTTKNKLKNRQKIIVVACRFDTREEEALPCENRIKLLYISPISFSAGNCYVL